MTELLQFSLFGLMLGCVYAIAAMGLVLTYTVTGVFNFAHGAVGMLAAFAYWELRVRHGVPTPVALAIVLLVLAPAMGLVAERLLRRFRGADYATSLVVTIALTVGLFGLATQVFDPGEARNVPYLFGDHRITVLSVPITYDRIAMVIIALAVAFGLRGLLFGTPLGARMRAVVDDRELARLNGVRSVMIARCSWMIGFMLAALGGVLFAGGENLNAIVLTLLVLNAYGAAMVGRLTNLPMTFVGALFLGLLQELTNVSWLWPSTDLFLRLRLAIPGLFLVAAVLLVPSFRLSAGVVVGREQPGYRRCATHCSARPPSSAPSPCSGRWVRPTSTPRSCGPWWWPPSPCRWSPSLACRARSRSPSTSSSASARSSPASCSGAAASSACCSADCSLPCSACSSPSPRSGSVACTWR